jgi:Xaa-Pro dipeptidase
MDLKTIQSALLELSWHITGAGYGEYFTRRTGHSIGVRVHGNGANLETKKDEPEIISNTCFSIEPGIYLPGEFGVRSEVNVLTRNGGAEVTGTIQRELVLI